MAALSQDEISSLIAIGGFVLLLLGTIVAGILIIPTKAVQTWRDTAQAYKEEATALMNKLEQMETKVKELESEIAMLRAKPDMSDIETLIKNMINSETDDAIVRIESKVNRLLALKEENG